MAQLTFRLTRDNNQVLFRELTIGDPAEGGITISDLDDFATADELVFANQHPIGIVPKTRAIKVIVRADAITGDGWELMFEFNKKPVPAKPIREVANNAGRANHESIQQWEPSEAALSNMTLASERSSPDAPFFSEVVGEEITFDFGRLSSQKQTLVLNELKKVKRRNTSKKLRKNAPNHRL